MKNSRSGRQCKPFSLAILSISMHQPSPQAFSAETFGDPEVIKDHI